MKLFKVVIEDSFVTTPPEMESGEYVKASDLPKHDINIQTTEIMDLSDLFSTQVFERKWSNQEIAEWLKNHAYQLQKEFNDA